MDQLTSEISPESLATLLPDLPRWLEARSMLLSRRGSVVGHCPGDPTTFVALQPDTGVASVIGRPPGELIQAVAERVSEVVAVPENAEWTAAALPGWKRERATLHVLSAMARLPAVPPGSVRYLDPDELARVREIPRALLSELLVEAQAGTRIAAALAGDRPVSFCYAGWMTERWWDISIDTLEPYRRQGYAARCVAFCIQELALSGKQPVWGAFTSNLASAQLAAKLGFEAVDTVVVFSRPVTQTSVDFE
jgi:hypothetical protein